MASENIKYLVRGKGQSLEATTSTRPTSLEPGEVMIRLKAVAVSPADIKSIDQGHRITSWPHVPGLDGAGIVDSVGAEVKRFVAGDEVFALFMPRDRGASFQHFAVVQEMMVAKKPSTLSFEEAASLPVSYFTGAMSLGIGLKTLLPFVEDGPKTGFQPSSVLILGGSSALGAAAIQLLRLAIPYCTIFVTCSPKHFAQLITLGATKAFDRNSSSLIEDVKSASPLSQGIEAIIDAVGAGSSQRHIFEALALDGPRRYAQVWTGDDEIEAPSDMKSVLFRSRDFLQLPGGKNVMLALQKLLEEEKYKLPLPVHRVGDGYAALEKGLELMRKGVSGEKLVVSL